MFVSSPTNLYPSYPAKPEPLRPIFTFAQSQSCMNLRLDMDVLDCQEKGMAGERMALEFARPKETYQSPLQRIGEALRIPRLELDTSHVALAPTPRPHSSLSQDSPTRETLNYSYKLLPSGESSPTLSETEHHAALGLALDRQDSLDTGSIIGPYTKAQIQTPRNKGYFAGTSLLSSFFSNPRTRAPFKPQKTNRGTSSWQLKQYAEATLGSGSLRKAVKLPEGEDKDEWLAVNGRTWRNAIKRCLAK
jgi:MOB kinase activator 1